MDLRFQTSKTEITANKSVKTNLNPGNSVVDSSDSQVIDVLLAEGGESLYNYVEWLGLINDPNLVVLSSQHHFYYGEEELKEVTNIVNLKQLNQIRNLNFMLQSVFKIMQLKSNFIGFFAENGSHKKYQLDNNMASADSDSLENGIVSRNSFVNRIYNFIDSKTNRYMTREDVRKLFEANGFNILDMTELNGLTFFYARKVQVVPE